MRDRRRLEREIRIMLMALPFAITGCMLYYGSTMLLLVPGELGAPHWSHVDISFMVWRVAAGGENQNGEWRSGFCAGNPVTGQGKVVPVNRQRWPKGLCDYAI